MRVFIAIDVPGEIRQRLGAMQDELRQVSSSARWVTADSIHLTLKFIGEISETQMPGHRHRSGRIDLEALQRLGSWRWVLSRDRIATRVLGRPRVFHDGWPGQRNRFTA